MTTSLTELLAPLRAADRSIVEAAGTARTLRPEGCTATSLEQLGRRVLKNRDPDVVHVFVSGLAAIAEAMVDNFPDTLFWDLDFMASEILLGMTIRRALKRSVSTSPGCSGSMDAIRCWPSAICTISPTAMTGRSG